MNVGVFYNSIANPKKFSNKTHLMDLFYRGVYAAGDRAYDVRTPGHVQTSIDVGFVLGYTLEDNFRRRIIDQLKSRNIPIVFVDSNILHYARGEHHWHRYSLNSVYPTQGTYFFQDIDTAKWEEYSSWHSVSLKPWRVTGDHVLICCQRPQGWNMMGNNQNQWLDHSIESIRQHTDRPIVVRLHPGDGKKQETVQHLINKYGTTITISNNAHILADLKNCWCAVGYNSTPNAVAAIEGVPVHLSDPVNSWAQAVAFTDMSMIENPPMPDRSQWLHQIANIHWSNQEVESGKLWSAIKSCVSKTR